jgi:Domain of unknown function (DUF4432)
MAFAKIAMQKSLCSLSLLQKGERMKAFFAGNSPKLMLDDMSVFDIGSCVVEDVDLAPGRAIPDDGDPRIDHSLEGFLFTCGPDHIRHPEPVEADAAKRYPLHGSYSSHPAQILSFDLAENISTAVAEIPVTMATGETARLTRTWTADGKTGVISLIDRLQNTGTRSFAPMHMYHINLGAKWFDDQTRLSGQMLKDGGSSWRFGEGEMIVTCVPALEHAKDGWAQLILGPIGAIGGRSLVLRFSVDQLPYLQLWRNQMAPAHILGIEPASHDWMPRKNLHEQGDMTLLEPGDVREYKLAFAFEPTL